MLSTPSCLTEIKKKLTLNYDILKQILSFFSDCALCAQKCYQVTAMHYGEIWKKAKVDA